jgi:hypothetical protein
MFCRVQFNSQGVSTTGYDVFITFLLHNSVAEIVATFIVIQDHGRIVHMTFPLV